MKATAFNDEALDADLAAVIGAWPSRPRVVMRPDTTFVREARNAPAPLPGTGAPVRAPSDGGDGARTGVSGTIIALRRSGRATATILVSVSLACIGGVTLVFSPPTATEQRKVVAVLDVPHVTPKRADAATLQTAAASAGFRTSSGPAGANAPIQDTAGPPARPGQRVRRATGNRQSQAATPRTAPAARTMHGLTVPFDALVDDVVLAGRPAADSWLDDAVIPASPPLQDPSQASGSAPVGAPAKLDVTRSRHDSIDAMRALRRQ